MAFNKRRIGIKLNAQLKMLDSVITADDMHAIMKIYHESKQVITPTPWTQIHILQQTLKLQFEKAM